MVSSKVMITFIPGMSNAFFSTSPWLDKFEGHDPNNLTVPPDLMEATSLIKGLHLPPTCLDSLLMGNIIAPLVEETSLSIGLSFCHNRRSAAD